MLHQYYFVLVWFFPVITAELVVKLIHFKFLGTLLFNDLMVITKKLEDKFSI